MDKSQTSIDCMPELLGYNGIMRWIIMLIILLLFALQAYDGWYEGQGIKSNSPMTPLSK